MSLEAYAILASVCEVVIFGCLMVTVHRLHQCERLCSGGTSHWRDEALEFWAEQNLAAGRSYHEAYETCGWNEECQSITYRLYKEHHNG